MPEYGHRRTALLIDVTTFGDTGDGAFEPPLGQLKPLLFGAKVDELAEAFTRVSYEVIRLTDPTADKMDAEIRRVVGDHVPGDVVAVHIMSHGYPGTRVDTLFVCGSDSTPDGPALDMGLLLRDFLVLENGPYVLFSLDLCHAGKAPDLDHAMRMDEPDKVWFVGGAPSTRAAFGARFTTALRNTLDTIRTGLPTVIPGLPYVPFTDFASTVREELRKIVSADPQHIPQQARATVIDGSQNVRDLPFFENHNEHPVPTPTPDELTYFISAATVRFTDDGDRTDFTGRAAEVRTLAGWLRGAEPSGPRLVTGRAGTGKSALLGALVCAAHPLLAQRVTSVAPQLGGLVPRAELMAAVPGKQRDVAGFVAMISAQLFGARKIHTPKGLKDALEQRREQDPACPPAIIVVDTLDEATAPAQVFDTLLRMLSDVRDARNKPVCEVVIACRSDSAVTPMLRDAAGSVIDLDEVDHEALHRDVEAYAWTLLSDVPGYRDRPDVRGALAGAVATRLVNAKSQQMWGEFLVTRLYLDHLVQNGSPVMDPATATMLGKAVPLDVTEVLELGLRECVNEVWARPVLAALALAHGSGAPTSVIADLAGVCRGEPLLRPEPAKLAEVLELLGSYLRMSPAPDGDELYQLFHEGVAEHLRDHPISPEVRQPVAAQEVCRALLGGIRSWATADRYVLRYGLHHARSTAELEKLLLDPGFLLCRQKDALLAVSEIAEDRTLDAEVRRLAGAAHRVMAEQAREPRDRERLALVAARSGSARLARTLATGTHVPVLVLDLPNAPATSAAQVLLSAATGGSVIQVYEPVCDYSKAFQVRHPYPVVSLCASTYHGAELITGDNRGTARVWPLVEGSIPRLTRAGHVGPVRALATIDHNGGPPVYLSADDHTLRLWNSEDGDWVKTIPSAVFRTTRLATFGTAERTRVLVQSALSNYVLNVATSSWEELPGTRGVTVLCPTPERTSVLCFGRQGVLSTVDLATFRQERWELTAGGEVTAAVHVPGLREPTVVSGDSSGRLTLWHLATRRSTHLGHVRSEVTALTSFVVNGRPVVVCASADGVVSAWDPEKCLRRTSFGITQSINAFAHDWSPATGKHRAAPLVRCGWGFDGVIVAMVDTDNTVKVHCSTGVAQTLGPFDRAIAGVSVVSVDDWAQVIVEDDRGHAQAWHPRTGQLLGEIAAGAVPGVLPPEQPLMLHDRLVQPEAGDDGLVRLLPRSGDDQDVAEFAAHSGRVTALTAWRSGGTAHLATGGADGLLRLWDAETQDLLHEVELPSAATNIVAVQGKHLVVQTSKEIIVLSQRESA